MAVTPPVEARRARAVGLIAHAFLRDRSRLTELLEAPRLPHNWKQWIEQRVGHGDR